MNATGCEDHRTVSLISHASKIQLRILIKRLDEKVRDFISKTRFGFKKGYETRDAIRIMRKLCEKVLDHGNKLFVCFVDYENALHRVKWVKMMGILKYLGTD